MNNDLKALDEELLENVTGGTGEKNNDDLMSVGSKLTWCGNCKTKVHYHEFTGGRYVCDNCGKFVDA